MKRRSIQRVPNVAEDGLIANILSIPSRQMRAYACFVYLFGNRVSEAIGLPKTEPTGEYYEYTRVSKKGSRIVKIPKTNIVPNEWTVEPLRAWCIEYDEKAGILWCRGIPTFKTSNRPVRDAWVLAGGTEKPMIDELWAYTLKVREEGGLDAPLFEMTRQAVYESFRKYLGMNAFPHKLRDLRATKDATTYGLDAKDLQEKFNWARPEMAMYYGRKNKTDIIAKMRKNTE
jgi:hypothetical protein